jgi:hypothetical protein
MKKIEIALILMCVLSVNCVYVYKNSYINAFLDPIGMKENNCQPMAFCIGGSSNKFSYIRIKPYSSTFLDTINLFKFFKENIRNDFHFGQFEHGDYGTPQGKLPIKIFDTSIVDIDSTVYGRHIENCSTIYFRLKKPGRTEMIIRMGMMKKDTIFLSVNDDGLSASKNRKERKGKTMWIGVLPLKN